MAKGIIILRQQENKKTGMRKHHKNNFSTFLFVSWSQENFQALMCQ